VPIVHSQESIASEDLRMDLTDKLSAFGGFVLRANETHVGEARFQWRMIEIMLSLMRAASRARSARGCPPSWVHFLSESDVPIRSCAETHAHLAQHANYSFADTESFTEANDLIRDGPAPAPFEHAQKASQWVTLTMNAAESLAGDEDALRARWTPTISSEHTYSLIFPGGAWSWGAVDEWLWVTELSHRQLPFLHKGLTSIVWCSDNGLNPALSRCFHGGNGELRPQLYTTFAEAATGCAAGRRAGYFFKRKFGDGSEGSSAEVLRAMTSEQCLAIPSPPPAPPWTDGRHNGQDCWALCGERAGECSPFCGEHGGACCRIGWNAEVAACGFGFGGCERMHCCTRALD